MSSDRPPNFLPRFIRISVAVALTTGTVVPSLVGCFIALDNYLDRKSERQYQQEQQVQIDRVRDLESAGKYEECIREAAKVPQTAPFFLTAQIHAQNCHIHFANAQIEQAQQQEARGEVPQAIAELSLVSADSPSYSKAQQLMRQWSERIWGTAQSYYWQPADQLNPALAIAETIPPQSPIYEPIQTQIQQWKQLWAENQQFWLTAQQALALNQLEQAMTAAQQIKDHPYWTPRRNAMIQEIQAQQQRQRYETIVETARELLRQELNRWLCPRSL